MFMFFFNKLINMNLMSIACWKFFFFSQIVFLTLYFSYSLVSLFFPFSLVPVYPYIDLFYSVLFFSFFPLCPIKGPSKTNGILKQSYYLYKSNGQKLKSSKIENGYHQRVSSDSSSWVIPDISPALNNSLEAIIEFIYVYINIYINCKFY